MSLQIHNTLTRKKEEFVPQDPAGEKVSFYNCGPTVYGPFHIGNGRNFVIVDVMRRWLEYLGFEVRFVQNLTDVDDKIIEKAKEEGVSSEEIATKYTALYFENIGRLGVRPADDNPKATEFIGPMIAMVKELVEKGHAYATEDGSVWFDVRSFKEYGKLSRKNLEEMRQGERVDEEQQKLKRSPADFCLWKASKPGEPAWKSPWGEGRPGWHTECSCMARKCHGDSATIDIHSGGVDLQFPHHENEIAQSEAVTGQPFVRYWIHNGFLNIDGEKMSKSLGNFRTIDALLERFDALTLRHFLLSAHYRTELDFTEENLEAGRKASTRYNEAQAEALRVLGEMPPADAWREAAELRELEERFRAAMNDDFNTAQAFAVLFDLVTMVNSERGKVESGEGDEGRLAGSLSLLMLFRELLGVTPELRPQEEDLGALTGDLLDLLIDVRAGLRKAKQFELADRVRDRLTELGITLEDKPGGTVWKKG